MQQLNFPQLGTKDPLSIFEGSIVGLRRHCARETMKWMPRTIGKDNGAVAQIVRNNGVAADMVGQDCSGDD